MNKVSCRNILVQLTHFKQLLQQDFFSLLERTHDKKLMVVYTLSSVMWFAPTFVMVTFAGQLDLLFKCEENIKRHIKKIKSINHIQLPRNNNGFTIVVLKGHFRPS